jgi:hypothetical protein
MSLYDQIIAVYPETEIAHLITTMKIILRDDADGSPQWIDKWDCELPLPEGMKIGK